MTGILSGVLEKFLSRKLGAFLAGIFAAYFSVSNMPPEAADRFLTFLQWICGLYLAAQGGVDMVEVIKKGAGIK